MKTLFTVFAFFIVVSIGNGQWSQCDGPYAGGAGTFFISGTTLFVNTSEGVLRSTDQGENWAMVKPGLLLGRISSCVTMGSNIYISGDDKYIFRSEDGGSNWKAIDSKLIKGVNCLTVIDNKLFVGATNGLYVTSDNGAEWTYRSPGSLDSNVASLYVIGTNMFAGTVKGTVYFSSDSGVNWTLASTGLLPSGIRLFTVLGNALLAVTRTEGIYASTDNGKNWKDISKGNVIPPVLSVAVIGSNLFAGAFEGLYLSTNSGSHWTLIRPSVTSSPGFFELSSLGNTLFAYGGGGPYNFVKTADNGKTWSIAYIPSLRLSPLSFCESNGNIFAGTADGVHLSTNNGENWKVVNTGLEKVIIMAMTSNGSNIFAGALDDKGVFLSSNNGKSWSAVNKGLGNLNIYQLITVGNTIFAGTEDGIYTSSDNGTNWKPSFATSNNSLGWVNSIVVNGNKIFAGNDVGSIYALSDDGIRWSKVSKSLEGYGITSLEVRGADLYAGTYRGVYRSTNNGEEWLPDTVGIYGMKIYCMVVKSGKIFAGTDSGVYMSRRAGATWIPVDSASKINLIVSKLALQGASLFASTQRTSTSTQTDRGVWKYNISILGVEDKDVVMSTSTLLCYPNPATNTLTIDRTSIRFAENTPVHYTLSTLLGGKVMEFDNSELKFTVQLDGLASGVYCLTAESGVKRAAVMVTVAE